MESMTDDQKSARSIRSGTPTPLSRAVTRGMQRVSDVGRAIQNAVLPAVFSPDSMENLAPLPCPRLPEDNLVDTSSTQRRTRRCPVSGKKIPSLKKIEQTIEKNLTLLNWRWPRSIAVKGVALVLKRWAEDVGLEKAARRGALLFEEPSQCYFRDTVPRLDPSERLTAEEFADHAENMIDELERRTEGDRCTERLLPCHGSTHPVDRSGDSSLGKRSGS